MHSSVSLSGSKIIDKITKISSGIAFAMMCLVHTQTNAEEPSDLNHCLALPEQNFNFTQISEDILRNWMPTLRYAVNVNHLSTQSDLFNSSTLRQRFVPTSRGSARVLAVAGLIPARTYILTQSIFIEHGFDWGGTRESGKIAFGLGGGSLPTGGDLSGDGFTVRLAWQGNHDGTARLGAYMYSSDRSQNLPYGDRFNIENFNVPMGEWFDVTLVVTANSAAGISDGSMSIFVNDEVRLWKSDIEWQSSGDRPLIDTLMLSSFHGGNSTAWSPDYTSYAKFSNICMTGY